MEAVDDSTTTRSNLFDFCEVSGDFKTFGREIINENHSQSLSNVPITVA